MMKRGKPFSRKRGGRQGAAAGTTTTGIKHGLSQLLVLDWPDTLGGGWEDTETEGPDGPEQREAARRWARSSRSASNSSQPRKRSTRDAALRKRLKDRLRSVKRPESVSVLAPSEVEFAACQRRSAVLALTVALLPNFCRLVNGGGNAVPYLMGDSHSMFVFFGGGAADRGTGSDPATSSARAASILLELCVCKFLFDRMYQLLLLAWNCVFLARYPLSGEGSSSSPAREDGGRAVKTPADVVHYLRNEVLGGRWILNLVLSVCIGGSLGAIMLSLEHHLIRFGAHWHRPGGPADFGETSSIKPVDMHLLLPTTSGYSSEQRNIFAGAGPEEPQYGKTSTLPTELQGRALRFFSADNPVLQGVGSAFSFLEAKSSSAPPPRQLSVVRGAFSPTSFLESSSDALPENALVAAENAAFLELWNDIAAAEEVNPPGGLHGRGAVNFAVTENKNAVVLLLAVALALSWPIRLALDEWRARTLKKFVGTLRIVACLSVVALLLDLPVLLSKWFRGVGG